MMSLLELLDIGRANKSWQGDFEIFSDNAKSHSEQWRLELHRKQADSQETQRGSGKVRGGLKRWNSSQRRIGRTYSAPLPRSPDQAPSSRPKVSCRWNPSISQDKGLICPKRQDSDRWSVNRNHSDSVLLHKPHQDINQQPSNTQLVLPSFERNLSVSEITSKVESIIQLDPEEEVPVKASCVGKCGGASETSMCYSSGKALLAQNSEHLTESCDNELEDLDMSDLLAPEEDSQVGSDHFASHHDSMDINFDFRIDEVSVS